VCPYNALKVFAVFLLIRIYTSKLALRNMRSYPLCYLATAVLLGVTAAAPDRRLRDTDAVTKDDINPVAIQDGTIDGLERGKRSGENPFGGKNAVLGFVFGKIDQLIDQKTKFIDQLDHQNIEKNKQHHIESPKPINSFQDLISAVITPKITAITSKIGSLSGSFLGGSSGNGSPGGSSDGGSGGLGGIVSSLLRLSGPLLTSSAGSGGSTNTNSVDDDDFNDDDFN